MAVDANGDRRCSVTILDVDHDAPKGRCTPCGDVETVVTFPLVLTDTETGVTVGRAEIGMCLVCRARDEAILTEWYPKDSTAPDLALGNGDA